MVHRCLSEGSQQRLCCVYRCQGCVPDEDNAHLHIGLAEGGAVRRARLAAAACSIAHAGSGPAVRAEVCVEAKLHTTRTSVLIIMIVTCSFSPESGWCKDHTSVSNEDEGSSIKGGCYILILQLMLLMIRDLCLWFSKLTCSAM